MAVEEQVRAYGGPRFQLTQQVMNRFAQAIEQSRVDVVPKILIGGGRGDGAAGNGANGGGMSGNVMEALLAMLLSDKLAADLGGGSPGSNGAGPARNPVAEQIRQKIQGDIAR